MSKIILVDGMSLVFRAFHALSSSNFTSPDGEPTGAIFGFSNIISGILDREKPDYIAVAFDTAAPTFRHVQFEQYKANRVEFPQELEPQLPKIKQYLDLIGIPQFEMPGFEADDIIGTLATQLGKEDMTVYCLTSDKDFFQLVNDHVFVLRPSSKPGGDFEIISYQGVQDKFGVNPDKVIDVLALTGDAVDNVPGVKGIGDKTAIPLIQQFGSLEELYENLDKIERDSVRNKLITDKENALLSKELVTIDTNVPIEYDIEFLTRKKVKYQELDSFFKELGFTKVRQYWHNKSLLEIGTVKPDLIIETPKPSSNEVIKFEILSSENEILQFLEKISNEKEIYFEWILSNSNRQLAEILGIAICSLNSEIKILRINQIENQQKTEVNFGLFGRDNLFANPQSENLSNNSSNNILEKLKLIFESKQIIKISDEIKTQAFVLKKYGLDISSPIFDISLASYIINPDESHTLDAIYFKWMKDDLFGLSDNLQKADSKKSEYLKIEFEEDDFRIKQYARILDAIQKLYPILNSELQEHSLDSLSNEIEFPLVEVLTDLEYTGVNLDSKSLGEFSFELETELVKQRKKIFDEAGVEFNLDSPKQLGHILFEKLGLPTIKKTKTGYSTDASVLAELSGINPIVDEILDYRQYTKLKSTYVDALPKLVNPVTNRIHTTFNQTIAATGRLSSTDPNLQNIPIRTEKGKEMRKAFIPSVPSNLILSADYSQIELRIMAFYTQDKSLIDAFKNNQDIHSTTAAKLFDCEISEVDSEKRRVAKAVNFGIMYGLGAFGLSQGLKITRNRAQQIINNYFEKYPGIKKYIDDTIKSTHEQGFAETLMKRRRYFVDINNKNQNIRTAAERAAINMPIQGTASDMIKIAMIRIYNSFHQQKVKSKMILQVHDEIVIDLIPSEESLVRQIVENDMVNAMSLGEVPVKIEIGIGKNWLEAH
jgi:DNA polymerase-1